MGHIVAAPAEIIELVERFDLHRESYQSSQYNETQLRREFEEIQIVEEAQISLSKEMQNELDTLSADA